MKLNQPGIRFPFPFLIKKKKVRIPQYFSPMSPSPHVVMSPWPLVPWPHVPMAPWSHDPWAPYCKRKWQLPYVCCKQKTETANFRLFDAKGNGKQKIVFLGRQTINANRRLLFQQTGPPIAFTLLVSSISTFTFFIMNTDSKKYYDISHTIRVMKVPWGSTMGFHDVAGKSAIYQLRHEDA
jgi:hypothetical protein